MYGKLMTALDNCLRFIAASDDKYTNLVLMENYHHLYASLSALDVLHTGEMEQAITDAGEHYHLYLERYTQFILRRQFSGLLAFFEDVDKMQATMPASEVQFQNAYTKQALRKVLGPFSFHELEQRLQARLAYPSPSLLISHQEYHM